MRLTFLEQRIFMGKMKTVIRMRVLRFSQILFDLESKVIKMGLGGVGTASAMTQ